MSRKELLKSKPTLQSPTLPGPSPFCCAWPCWLLGGCRWSARGAARPTGPGDEGRPDVDAWPPACERMEVEGSLGSEQGGQSAACALGLACDHGAWHAARANPMHAGGLRLASIRAIRLPYAAVEQRGEAAHANEGQLLSPTLSSAAFSLVAAAAAAVWQGLCLSSFGLEGAAVVTLVPDRPLAQPAPRVGPLSLMATRTRKRAPRQAPPPGAGFSVHSPGPGFSVHSILPLSHQNR